MTPLDKAVSPGGLVQAFTNRPTKLGCGLICQHGLMFHPASMRGGDCRAKRFASTSCLVDGCDSKCWFSWNRDGGFVREKKVRPSVMAKVTTGRMAALRGLIWTWHNGGSKILFFQTGRTPAEALQMASLRPAEFLEHNDDQFGSN